MPTHLPVSHLVKRRIKGQRAWKEGFQAEQQALRFFYDNGWQILLHRARTAVGEIDLVVRKSALLSFVEVKKRTTHRDAAECLGSRQKARIIGAAECLLMEHPEWTYDSISFDLVIMNDRGRLQHIANAFWLE